MFSSRKKPSDIGGTKWKERPENGRWSCSIKTPFYRAQKANADNPRRKWIWRGPKQQKGFFRFLGRGSSARKGRPIRRRRWIGNVMARKNGTPQNAGTNRQNQQFPWGAPSDLRIFGIWRSARTRAEGLGLHGGTGKTNERWNRCRVPKKSWPQRPQDAGPPPSSRKRRRSEPMF